MSSDLAEMVDFVEIPHGHDPRSVTDHFPVVVRFRWGDSGAPPLGPVLRIESIIPNPSGNENNEERATIVNLGTASISLSGWKLRDRANTIWSLDSLATLGPGESKTIKRNGQQMAMNNRGDTIELVSPTGTVAHSLTYERAEEGEVILGLD